MADIKKLAEELVNWTVKEVNELANVLKEEYGIEPAAAAVAVAAATTVAALIVHNNHSELSAALLLAEPQQLRCSWPWTCLLHPWTQSAC